MPDNKLTIQDSPERVAYDLMVKIYGTLPEQGKDREFFFKLYSQCRKVVFGYSLKDVLKED
jgi:hypothetical protein